MTVNLLDAAPPQVATPDRFLVLWQAPEDRSYHRVGTLQRDENGYIFAYTANASTVSGFLGFASFPDFESEYRSPTPFPTFANRVMTPRRDNYEAYVRSLGLGQTRPEPFEVLARTLGTRATDLVQLMPVPVVDVHGLLSFYFLVHGSRHVDPDGARLARLRPGDRLFLAPDADNPVSGVAVLVGDAPQPVRESALGYVPDALATLVHRLLAMGTEHRATAEQVNQPASSHVPDHMRLLVRFDAVVPDGFDVDSALPS